MFLLVCLVCISVTVYAAPLQYLTKTIEPETAFETASTRWSAGDNDTIQIAIGFDFPFNGVTYNSIWINSNGMLSFNSSNIEANNQNLPYGTEPQSIYPYWDNLNRDRGQIRYGTLGTGDTAHLVIHWKNVKDHVNRRAKYTFQTVLYKDGTIRFRYDAGTSANGISATIGVQEDVTYFDEHSYNSIIDQTKDIVYYPLEVDIAKTSCVISDTINLTTNPKRIPGATIRYAFEVKNIIVDDADNVIVSDDLSTFFDHSSIQNLQIQSGACDCLGVSSTSNNGANGTSNGVNPVQLDFGTVLSGSVATPSVKCGYFEVDIQ